MIQITVGNSFCCVLLRTKIEQYYYEKANSSVTIKSMGCQPPGLPQTLCLTHWGWVTHICVSKLTIIGSDNGLLPGRCQAIIWTNAAILLIRTLRTNFNEILCKIIYFHSRQCIWNVCEMSAILSRPQCVNKTSRPNNIIRSNHALRTFMLLSLRWQVLHGIASNQWAKLPSRL